MDIFGFKSRAEKRAQALLSERLKAAHIEDAKLRGFAAAKMTDLLNNWVTTTQKLDADLKAGLRTVRARSRDASQNNDYCRKYLDLVKTNVIGPKGIELKPKVKNKKGQPDTDANDRILEGWLRWLEKGNFDVTGKLGGIEGQELFIETSARDGEVLIYKNKFADNPFKFAVQFLDVDLLDESYHAELRNGNYIKMGIEFNQMGKPVAYHLTQYAPSQDTYLAGGRYRMRIPASEIIHAFRLERAHQSRGYPWTASALVEMHHIDAFAEAAIVASRLGASNMGFFTRDPSSIGRGFEGDQANDDGSFTAEISAGQFINLPRGVQFTEFNPDYPHQVFDSFMKRAIKKMASGLQVSYTSIASDPEGTSFSSMRGEVMVERDHWRTLQRYTISGMLAPIFPDFLERALLTQQIALPYEHFDKYNRASWEPRSWGYVDPLKDVTAQAVALKNGLKSHTTAAAEQGYDFSDEMDQAEKDIERLKSLGLFVKEVKP